MNVKRDLWEMSKGREETSEEPKDTSKSKINGEKRNLKPPQITASVERPYNVRRTSASCQVIPRPVGRVSSTSLRGLGGSLSS